MLADAQSPALLEACLLCLVSTVRTDFILIRLRCSYDADRGDSAGAAAIQTVQFWTRPGRGLLAASLSRWMALLHRRRAKVCSRTIQKDRHLLKGHHTHHREGNPLPKGVRHPRGHL